MEFKTDSGYQNSCNNDHIPDYSKLVLSVHTHRSKFRPSADKDSDDFRAVSAVSPLSERLKKFTKLSVPLILSFLMMNIQEQINLIFIGSL